MTPIRTIKNDRFLKALARLPVDRPPIWIKRQAGRYLPEYRALRQQAKDFMSFCRTPELCCEATLQPIRRFGFDAAIVFSDILTIPDAMGAKVEFHEGEGPVIPAPIQTENDIKTLIHPAVNHQLKYVLEAVSLCRKALGDTIPLIGFSGSPWTLACYMVEGQITKTHHKIKRMMFRDPKLLHLLLEKIKLTTIDYLNAQIDHGADVVMIFDTWGGVLTPSDYQEFSLQYMHEIVAALHHRVPTILFSKGCAHALEAIAQTGCEGIGVDWTINLKTAKERVGHRVALQGNLDPCALYGNAETVRAKTLEVLEQYQHQPGHIFNLGHGIYPDIDPEMVAVMTETVKSFQNRN